MTDNEIIKAMEWCWGGTSGKCRNCPLEDTAFCEDELQDKVLSLINHQKEQIESLISGQETLQKYIAEKDAEIESLDTELAIERIRRKNAVNAYHEEKDKNQNIKQKRSKSEWGSDKIVSTIETTEYQNIKEIKSEAVKEFAEIVKKKRHKIIVGGDIIMHISEEEIDGIYRKMVGGAE